MRQDPIFTICCPGGTIHQLKCCAVPDYYFSDCNTFPARFGEPFDCRDHGDNVVVEGQCHSGENNDCHGQQNLVTCCQELIVEIGSFTEKSEEG